MLFARRPYKKASKAEQTRAKADEAPFLARYRVLDYASPLPAIVL